jgi:hypothetical protein
MSLSPRPPIPTSPRAVAPFGDADGAVIAHAGRYSRECVLLAFEMIGGVERMADWADRNPTEFYTKIFTKTITKEVEINASEGIEDLLLRLDGGQRPHEPVEDAEWEPADDA